MLNKNKSDIVFFCKHKKLCSFFNFLVFIELKFSIMDIILIFKFSKYLNSFIFFKISDCINIFNLNKPLDSFINQSYYNHRHFGKKLNRGYWSILYHCNSKKKNKIIQLILKKKAGLFKRRGFLKKSLFFKNYNAINKHNRLIKHKNIFRNYKNKLKLKELSNNVIQIKRSPRVFVKKLKRESVLNKNNISNYMRTFNFKYIKNRRKYKRTNVIRINRRFKKVLYNNRSIFNNFFFNKKVPQYKITKYVDKFKNQKKKNNIYTTRFSLFIVLLSSRFFFFKQDSFYFIKVYGVFINGRISKNPLKILKVGDVLQIPIVSTYYFFVRNSNEYWIYFYKKYLKIIDKLRYRPKEKNIPNWVYRLTYFNLFVPYYLEVDYVLLTIVVLYEPKAQERVFEHISKYVAIHLMRTYNWRTLA